MREAPAALPFPCPRRKSAGRQWVGLVLALVALHGCSTAPWRRPPPADPAPLQAAADAAYAATDWPGAVAQLQALVAAVPSNASHRFRLGNALVRAGRLEEALNAYTESLRLDPAQPKAQHNLAVVHLRLAQSSLAQAANGNDTETARRAAGMRRQLDALLEAAQ